jgi:hypothetical protein
VIAGSIIRVELLPGPRAFDAIIAIVLVPLGAQLIIRRTAAATTGWAALLPIVPIAGVVGCVGGTYGIGGGSILGYRTGAWRRRDRRRLLRGSTPTSTARGRHPSTPAQAGRQPRPGASAGRSRARDRLARSRYPVAPQSREVGTRPSQSRKHPRRARNRHRTPLRLVSLPPVTRRRNPRGLDGKTGQNPCRVG